METGHEVNPDPSPTSVMASAKSSSDNSVALELLHYFHSKSRFPSSSTALSQLLVEGSGQPKVVRDYVKANQKTSHVRSKLQREFERLSCLAAKSGKYKWDMSVVEATVAETTNFFPSSLHHSTTKDAPVEAASALTVMKAKDIPIKLVNTEQALREFAKSSLSTNSATSLVAMDCEYNENTLFLIQVSTTDGIFVLDCVEIDGETFCNTLSVLLQNPDIIKVCHDMNRFMKLLGKFGVAGIQGMIDTQLAAESLTGKWHLGFNETMEVFGAEKHTYQHATKARMEDSELFARRPIPKDILKYAVADVRLLIGAAQKIRAKLGDDAWGKVQRSSDARAKHALLNDGKRRMAFDVMNQYALASYELLEELRPNDMLIPKTLKISNETDTLVSLLPEDLVGDLRGRLHQLSDIMLDKGRPPHAWVSGERVFLGTKGRLIGVEEIDSIVEKLGGFGSDNRAGLEKQLHRISAIRNRDFDIIGLTMRVGRHISGNAGMITDFLFADQSKSILFLGEPGSGKTTIVREVTRLLAERTNVCIVDTSNEIAGDGDIPHPCVGFARRMMVPSLDKQSAVMVECVQNHTPETIVIDEIGRSTEVEAARTCKNRGVRLIASAHGDMRKLIKNPKLRGLVGGIEKVTLGDEQAKAEAKRRQNNGPLNKVKTERAGPPVFEVIVELSRGEHHVWRIIENAAEAVDKILDSQQFTVQERIRDPETGMIQAKFDKS